MRLWTQSFIVALVSVVLLFFVQACAPKSQEECGFVQNVYGERISWKGQLPIVMKIHESVPASYYDAVVQAAESWNKTYGKTLITVDKNNIITGPVVSMKDTQNVIYFYPTWEANKTTEQARTSVYWLGDAIKEADIRINAKDFQYYDLALNNKGPSRINLQALVIHEMGHVLGLKHKDTDSSVMATYLASQSDRVQIAQTDKKSLSCEY
jgi:predicted Zn-dependent protease